MLAFARLLRLSLAPTVAADVIVGVLIGHAGRWPGGGSPWLLVGASLLIYHGAMALNDWADREQDAHTRPGRPIPSGAVSPSAALVLGWAMPAAGVCLAATVSAPLAMGYGLLAACAWVYDLKGRGPWRGPMLLGLCRGGNLALGMALAWSTQEPVACAPTPILVAAPLLYATFIGCVSLLGRLEDGQGGTLGRRPTRFLKGAAAALGAIPALGLALSPAPTAWAWAACAALALGSAAWLLNAIPSEKWTQELVGQAMGRALRSTLPFTAALAILHAGDSVPARWVALSVLTALPLSHALRRVLPPS